MTKRNKDNANVGVLID